MRKRDLQKKRGRQSGKFPFDQNANAFQRKAALRPSLLSPLPSTPRELPRQHSSGNLAQS